MATREELEFHLGAWTQKRYRAFPILYLAFHGSPGEISLSDGRKTSAAVPLEWIEEQLAGRCKGRVNHFGSCSTLDVRRPRLQRFLRKTGATAIRGHREDTDWIRSAAFEILLLDAFQHWSLTRSGARAVEGFIKREILRVPIVDHSAVAIRELGHLVPRQRYPIPHCIDVSHSAARRTKG